MVQVVFTLSRHNDKNEDGRLVISQMRFVSYIFFICFFIYLIYRLISLIKTEWVYGKQLYFSVFINQSIHRYNIWPWLQTPFPCVLALFVFFGGHLAICPLAKNLYRRKFLMGLVAKRKGAVFQTWDTLNRWPPNAWKIRNRA